MDELSGFGTDSFHSLDGHDLVHLIDRLPFAVALLGEDGYLAQASDLAIKLFERTAVGRQRMSLLEVDWDLVDANGSPVAMRDYPSLVTLLTGEEFDNTLIGFPGTDGERLWLRLSTRRLSDGAPPYRVITAFSDVTAEQRAVSEVGLMGQMLGHAFDHAPIGIALVGTDGRWLRVNQALSDLLGYSETELLAATFQDITHPDDLEADLALLEDALSGRRSSYQLNKRYIRSDGRQIWAQLSVAVVTDKTGTPLHFISQVQDVTERHRLEARLRELADHDHLTGLLNRRRFEEELDRQLERCARHDERAALLLMDIDRFKEVNDSGGHAAGDSLLQTVAEVCQRRVRGTDLVARVGGDEFAAILVDSDEMGALQVAQTLRDAIREVEPKFATASIGVTTMRADDRPDTVLARADRALYAVKEGGRNDVRLADTLNSIR